MGKISKKEPGSITRFTTMKRIEPSKLDETIELNHPNHQSYSRNLKRWKCIVEGF